MIEEKTTYVLDFTLMRTVNFNYLFLRFIGSFENLKTKYNLKS
jgi:hypothetical protein